ncbi:hypothetical protein AZA_50487 [Nitrospirillum viridazoti Y2]|nr:hypothetical protein AZA_50487 [Nitrospirillum amazonense Y2]
MAGDIDIVIQQQAAAAEHQVAQLVLDQALAGLAGEGADRPAAAALDGQVTGDGVVGQEAQDAAVAVDDGAGDDAAVDQRADAATALGGHHQQRVLGADGTAVGQGADAGGRHQAGVGNAGEGIVGTGDGAGVGEACGAVAKQSDSTPDDAGVEHAAHGTGQPDGGDGADGAGVDQGIDDAAEDHGLLGPDDRAVVDQGADAAGGGDDDAGERAADGAAVGQGHQAAADVIAAELRQQRATALHQRAQHDGGARGDGAVQGGAAVGAAGGTDHRLRLADDIIAQGVQADLAAGHGGAVGLQGVSAAHLQRAGALHIGAGDGDGAAQGDGGTAVGDAVARGPDVVVQQQVAAGDGKVAYPVVDQALAGQAGEGAHKGAGAAQQGQVADGGIHLAGPRPRGVAIHEAAPDQAAVGHGAQGGIAVGADDDPGGDGAGVDHGAQGGAVGLLDRHVVGQDGPGVDDGAYRPRYAVVVDGRAAAADANGALVQHRADGAVVVGDGAAVMVRRHQAAVSDGTDGGVGDLHETG